MAAPTTEQSRNPNARFFLVAGVLLLVLSALAHEWTISYLLQPSTPLRLSARLHWWYISLNAGAVGLWLILRRDAIRPIAVIALSLVYGLLICLLVAVDLARAYVAITRSDQRTVIGEYMVPDNQLGWTVKANARARIVRQGLYDVSYQIGPDGFRRTVPDSDTSRRIYVLGDSFAFGWGVNDHETFSSRLAELQYGRAKVVNTGVEGHGIPQIYARFGQIEAEIAPDDIVVFTVIGDDIHRTWPDFVFVSMTLFGRKPLHHFPVFDKGEIRIEETNSLGNKLKALLVYGPWLGSLAGPLLLPSAEKSLEDTAEIIDRVKDAVEGKGARFLLIQLPTGGEVRHKQVALDLSRYGALQFKNRFPVDLETLRTLFISEDDGHYSPRGHRLVGDLLQEEFVEHGWFTQ